MKVELYDERINVHQGTNKTGSSHRRRGAGEQENPIQIHFIPPDLSNLDTVYPLPTVSTRFSQRFPKKHQKNITFFKVYHNATISSLIF